MSIRLISKQEAHEIIDSITENTIMLIEYNGILGISNKGKHIRKKKGKKYVDKAASVVLSQEYPITMLNLHRISFNDLSEYDRYCRTDITKSILLPKLE